MPSPLTTKRNNYHKKTKNSTVKTPLALARQLFRIVANHSAVVKSNGIIFDPCIGRGALVEQFMGHDAFNVLGMDIRDTSSTVRCHCFKHGNFLEAKGFTFKPDYVLMNPPFNRDGKNKAWLKRNKLGNALLPELFVDHVFKLWGPRTKVVMIAPMGFRLNQHQSSTRWQKYRDSKARITSIMSLPRDVFEGVDFHCEVLFWNMSGLNPHYWYGEDV